MNRREFLGAAATLALGAAVETMLPSRIAADTLPRMYLPAIIAKPEPPAYDERKGAVIIRSADDVAMLGAGWWYDYTPDPSYAAPGFVPMVRDPYQLAQFRDLDWSTGWVAENATVLFYNEPNLIDQMYGLDLTPSDVAADLHELHLARPDLQIVGPSLYYYGNWRWQHDDLIAAYESAYGEPMPIVAIAAHAIDCNVSYVVQKIERQISHYTDAGYDLPVWITEYMKGSATCWPNPESPADVALGVWQHYADDDRIERMCWFPARWDPAWTDPGGVGWTSRRLIDCDGMLTETGVVYQGLGG